MSLAGARVVALALPQAHGCPGRCGGVSTLSACARWESVDGPGDAPGALPSARDRAPHHWREPAPPRNPPFLALKVL